VRIQASIPAVLGLLFLGGTASADIIKDPDMAMDAGSFSSPLSQFTSFTPSQTTGGGILDLYNDTGHLLTSLSLTAYINTGLPQGLIASAFACSTGPHPFFENCGITYDSVTGALTMSFFGVQPGDDDETSDAEIGEKEGIPALKPGCEMHPDADGCGQGHFGISFNNGFSFEGDTGGWVASDQVNYCPPGSQGPCTTTYALFNGPPGFEVTTPEPAAIVLFSTVLLVIAATRRKNRQAH